MTLPTVDVAVNVVRGQDGRVLLAERTARQVAAGFWELPGGKIDPGETPAQAAARELEEEIGIVATGLSPWITYEHAFRTKRVRLHLFQVAGWRGTPHGREGQRLAWVDPVAPAVAPVLPSNDRALATIGLPRIMLDVDVLGTNPNDLHAELAGQAYLVRLHLPAGADNQRLGLARRLASIANGRGARVLLSGAPGDARRAGAEGVHTGAAELARMAARPMVPLWSVSCHDAAELRRAASLGADLAIVSPALAGQASCGRPPLGWDAIRRLAAAAAMPVYASGGVSLADLPRAQEVGCAGIVLGYGQTATRH